MTKKLKYVNLLVQVLFRFFEQEAFYFSGWSGLEQL